MSTTLDQLKTSVTSLSDPEKAELAEYLLESIEPGTEAAVAESWRVELERRFAEMESGKVVGKPVEEVLARLRIAYS